MSAKVFPHFLFWSTIILSNTHWLTGKVDNEWDRIWCMISKLKTLLLARDPLSWRTSYTSFYFPLGIKDYLTFTSKADENPICWRNPIVFFRISTAEIFRDSNSLPSVVNPRSIRLFRFCNEPATDTKRHIIRAKILTQKSAKSHTP